MSPKNDRDHSVLSCHSDLFPLSRFTNKRSHISKQIAWEWPEVMSLDAQRVGLLLVWN